jgi:hypothetical protein
MEPIISAMLGIALIGVVCWILIAFVPMPEPFPKLVIGAGVILTLLWLLRAFGVFQGFK